MIFVAPNPRQQLPMFAEVVVPYITRGRMLECLREFAAGRPGHWAAAITRADVTAALREDGEL